MNKQSRSTRRIAYYAVMLAIIFVSMTLDRMLSFWGVLSFAVIALSATSLFSLVRNDFWSALAAGFFFGLSSNITAFMFGKTVFFYPWTAILPRLFVGIAAFGIYKLVQLVLSKMKNTKVSETIALTFAGAFAPLTNTLCTLTCLWLFAKGDPLFVAFSAILVTNFLPEIIICTIVTPLLVLGVRRGLRLGIDGNPKQKQVATTEPQIQG